MALSPYFCEQSIDNNKGHGVRLLGRTHGALLVRNNTKRKSLNSKGLNEYNKLMNEYNFLSLEVTTEENFFLNIINFYLQLHNSLNMI